MSKPKVPISPEVLAFKRERWAQHERELDYIQDQYKGKLARLQKLLIAHKSMGEFSNQQKRHRKPANIVSNVNKSIQLDAIIQAEMDRQSNKYDFSLRKLQRPTLPQLHETIAIHLQAILTTLKSDIERMETSIEEYRNQSNQSGLFRRASYYDRLDELTAFRAKQHLIEQTIEELHDKPQDLTPVVKLVTDNEAPLEPLESELLLKRLQSMEEEHSLHKLATRRHLEEQQRISDKVKREMQKLGVVPKRKQLEIELLHCKSESAFATSSRVIPTSMPKLQSISPRTKLTGTTKANSYWSVLQPEQSPIVSPIQSILVQCEKLHLNCNNLDWAVKRQQKRKNVKLRKLDQQISTVRQSNFLENKLILI